MEQSFSQRMGFRPVKSVIQVDTMDDELRAALWNDLTLHVWNRCTTPTLYKLFTNIWMYFFKKLFDDLPSDAVKSNDKFLKIIKESYFKMEWHEVYDFVEFVAKNYSYHDDEYVAACNVSLKRELSAYRFVGRNLVQITSDEEVAEIEEALSVSRAYTPHLEQALNLLADRKSPDYRNSIKESISAVEAICQLVTGSSRTTLGEALRRLESKLGSFHPALKNAFNSLYGYTSDAQGIRHALQGESNLDVEDARFMLIACSAFINYLVAKANKAGIQLPDK